MPIQPCFVPGTIPAKTANVVISTFRLFPSREERRHLLTILRSVQGPIKAQPHNQCCRVYEEDGFDGAVLYMERWDSEPEFERHVRSEAYRRILAVIEFSRKPPEIVFDYVTTSRGMDLIEALRGESNQP
jgi:quinol monooxygenase YgiN